MPRINYSGVWILLIAEKTAGVKFVELKNDSKVAGERVGGRSLDAEGQGVPSVPGAKWLIKPGEIQLGAFNTYRGWMRSVASPTMLHDFSRWLWPRSQLRAPAGIYQRRGERSRSNSSSRFRETGLARQTNKPVCVVACARCMKHARGFPRIERRYGPIQRAKHRLINERARTMRQRPTVEWYILVSRESSCYAHQFIPRRNIFITRHESGTRHSRPASSHGPKSKLRSGNVPLLRWEEIMLRWKEKNYVVGKCGTEGFPFRRTISTSRRRIHAAVTLMASTRRCVNGR